MNFTDHYTATQQLMVEKLNAEINKLGLTSMELYCGYDQSQVDTVLNGRAPTNPAKVIDALWPKVFGDASVDEIASDSRAYNAKYKPEDITLCQRINLRMQAPDMRQQNVTCSSIAKSLGKSTGQISQLINGKYNANPTKHLHAIWALIEPAPVNQTAAEAAKADTTEEEAPAKKPIHIRYGDVPFVRTSISDFIELACDHAKDRRRFSVFCGQPGLGKSFGIDAYCKKNDNAILIMGSEQTSSTQILEQLCRKLGLIKGSSAARSMEKIIMALRDTDRLIILDEADKCKPNALDPLRTISDSARVGVTLIGNNKLIDNLQSQERFELIASRVCFWPKPLGQIQVTDIKTLFEQLTQGQIQVADDTDKWWQWLHKRVEGNARELVENLLPHLIRVCNRSDEEKKVDRLLVNSIFQQVLNKPAI